VQSWEIKISFNFRLKLLRTNWDFLDMSTRVC